MLSSAVLSMSFVQASTLPEPKGDVILTVSGHIANTGKDGKTVHFDRQMLLDLGVVKEATSTPWNTGVNTYSGPSLRKLLDYVGAKGKELTVSALNDYSAKVPVSDAYDYNVVLAMDLNGEPMSIRDKGPLFIVYPFDQVPSLNNEVIHNRSVWQIKAIRVE